MEKLPPEGRAIVAEYYVRLQRSGVADINAKVDDFETQVWECFDPTIIDNDDPISVAEAEEQLNTLRQFVQSVGAGSRREHCLTSLPVVAIGLLTSWAYVVFEHFMYSRSRWGLLYAIVFQLAFCFVVLTAALRVLWPTEGFRTRVVLALKHIRSYFSTGFRAKEFIPDFLVTGFYLYLVFWCAIVLACFINPFAWILAQKIYALLFNFAVVQFLIALSCKLPFSWMPCLMVKTYVGLWDGAEYLLYAFIGLNISTVIFLLPGAYFAVILMNKFMHLRWVRARLDALEYRLYRVFHWLQRRGFLLID